MPRRLPPESMQLRFAVVPDEAHYPDHSPDEQCDFLLLAMADGPVLDHRLPADLNPRRMGPMRSSEILTLRTRVPTSRKAIDDIYLHIDQSVTVEMEIQRFDSDWESCGEYSDLLVPAKATLGYDALGLFKVEVEFEDDWPLEFAKEVFKKQLDGPSAVSHQDLRLLQIMFEISPQLVRDFRLLSGAARSELLHPAIEAIVGQRNAYYALGPSPGASVAKRRQDIIRALCDPRTILNMNDLRDLFGQELAEVDRQTGLSSFVPAKHETVSGLLKKAGITPILRGYYLGRDITHIAVPHSLQARASQRNSDLMDELIDSGIDVPGEPIVIR